jgi:hypothetical protein
VPAVINLPKQSLVHQPAVVLVTSLWNPASTLHLYQPRGGFCQVTVCCCGVTGVLCCCNENQSNHACMAWIPTLRPVCLTLFQTFSFLFLQRCHNNC